MANIFVIGDTHFGHANILTFKDKLGLPLRPFADVEEMDETIVAKWNKTVRPQDHVYHLGDVAMKRPDVERICPRLNGHLRLVRGNHDIFATSMYLKYFDEVYGSRVLDDMILTHIPIHPESIKERWHGNVHGHLHSRSSYSGKYFNASCEMIDYTPISLEDVKKKLKSR